MTKQNKLAINVAFSAIEALYLSYVEHIEGNGKSFDSAEFTGAMEAMFTKGDKVNDLLKSMVSSGEKETFEAYMDLIVAMSEEVKFNATNYYSDCTATRVWMESFDGVTIDPEIVDELGASGLLFKKPQSASDFLVGDDEDEEETSVNKTKNKGEEVKAAQQIKVGDSMIASINALMSNATNNKISDVQKFIDESLLNEAKLSQALADLAQEKMKASMVHVPVSGTVKASVGDLTYTLVYKKGYDCFDKANGKSTKKSLNFDIPTLEWRDSAGNLVQHPETPDIDPNYSFDAKNLYIYLVAFIRGNNTWLYGHTGTGKSTFIEQIAARIGFPVSRVNLDSNLERNDLVGHVSLTVENGATVTKYEEGILPRAMQRPGFMLMDEMDAGRPEILFVVQRSLEGKGLMLTEDNGRVVQPHPLFRFAATANTRGQGDEFGMYSGTRSMNASMIDRFPTFIEFDYMSRAQEKDLLLKLVPVLDPDTAEKMAHFAEEVRKAFSKGDIYNTISPRGLSEMAGMYATFTSHGTQPKNALDFALNATILNKAPVDTRQKFIEFASRVFGQNIK